MSELYRDFIDGKADAIINSLGGTITPAPANAELYRDFLDRKFDDVITALNGSITPAPISDELYRDFIERKFDDVISGIGSYIPSVSFPTVSGSICTFNSQYAGLPLKSCVVDFSGTGIDSLDFSATGKNLLDTFLISGTYAGVTYANDENGIVSLNGTKYGGAYAPFSNARISMRAGVAYTFSINLLGGTIRRVEDQSIRSLQCYLTSFDNVNVMSVVVNEYNSSRLITVIPDEDAIVYPRFAWWSDNTAITDVRIQMQVEINSISTDFVKYNGTQKTFSFGKTIQNGTLNVLTGELTNNDTTPPEEINLGGMDNETLQGVNNIFADTGDTTLQYIKIGGNT